MHIVRECIYTWASTYLFPNRVRLEVYVTHGAVTFLYGVLKPWVLLHMILQCLYTAERFQFIVADKLVHGSSVFAWYGLCDCCTFGCSLAMLCFGFDCSTLPPQINRTHGNRALPKNQIAILSIKAFGVQSFEPCAVVGYILCMFDARFFLCVIRCLFLKIWYPLLIF